MSLEKDVTHIKESIIEPVKEAGVKSEYGDRLKCSHCGKSIGIDEGFELALSPINKYYYEFYPLVDEYYHYNPACLVAAMNVLKKFSA